MKERSAEPRIWASRDPSAPALPQRALARQMRAKPTDAERKLWWHLRHRLKMQGAHFRRQVRIGRYLADFACHSAKLVIEVDGGQHAARIDEDAARTEVLQAHGYRVLRFWNNDVLSNIDGVLEEVQRAVTTTPTPDPSPQGGGESPVAPPRPKPG